MNIVDSGSGPHRSGLPAGIIFEGTPVLDIWYSLSPLRLPSCLDAAERLRMMRFVNGRSRNTFDTAHSLTRHVLSAYQPVCSPSSWRFEHSSFGKPSVASPFAYRFNLSHSDTAIAIAVCSEDVGVDIEQHRPIPAMAAMADLVLHSSERQWWRAQGSTLAAFLRLWTLKESLLKALGTGFSRPACAVCWEDLDRPWARAWQGGRAWLGATVDLGPATLAVAAPQPAVSAGARLLQVVDPGEGWGEAPAAALQWRETSLSGAIEADRLGRGAAVTDHRGSEEAEAARMAGKGVPVSPTRVAQSAHRTEPFNRDGRP